MEIEEASLQCDIFHNKSSNQQDYMRSLQSCLDERQSRMMEIVRTEEKIDSTLKVILNHKLNSETPFKQIIICCQKENDAKQYFQHIKLLANKYPQIQQRLLIVKFSNKKSLCIEQNLQPYYDEELYCKYKRKVDTSSCALYKNYQEYIKVQKKDQKQSSGLFDEEYLKNYGMNQNMCPYFFQDSLIQQGADIIICLHHNIFKDKEKHKDINQFLRMGNERGINDTFLFVDQSQYLLEDIQAYNSYFLDQELIHKTINKCTQLKKIVFEESKIVQKENIRKVNSDYEKLITRLEKALKAQKKAEIDKNPSSQRQDQNNEMPPFVKNPILLLDFIENVSYEVNNVFETYFSKLDSKLCQEDQKKNQLHGMKKQISHILSTDNVLDLLKDLKNHFPIHYQLRLVLDELFSFMFLQLNSKQEIDTHLPLIYIMSDFSYHFSQNFCDSSSDLPQQKHKDNNVRCYFQDHPEHLKEGLIYPILSFVPTKVGNISRKFFQSCSNFVLSSDCIISKQEYHSSIFGVDPIPLKNFELEPQQRYNVLPLFITKWNDQSAFESSRKAEDQTLQLRNYVNIVNSVCIFIPDGIVVYLPNISFFLRFIKEKVKEILSSRPVFFEHPYSSEKTLEYYKKSCDVGGGALFICTANGWARRHLEFQDQYARAVLILGFPQRDEYYRPIEESSKIYSIPKEDFLTYDTIQRVASCIKSVYTHSKDYCTIILADQKLRLESDYLPKWAKQNIKGQDELTVDDLFGKILEYSKCMGKLYSK